MRKEEGKPYLATESFIKPEGWKGVKVMSHKTYVKTRYCETDALGHVNNVSYFIYLEQARVDFFLGSAIVEDVSKWPFVAASVKCDFRRQAYVNQELAIKTYVSHIGRTSVKLMHEIIDEKTEELIAQGEDVLVHYDLVNQQSMPLSSEIVDKLQKYVVE